MNVAETAARLKARKFVPTPEQAARIDSAHKTLDWLWSLPPEQLGPLAGQHVAAYECQIVGIAKTHAELMPLLSMYDNERLVIEWIPLRNRGRVRA